VEVLRGKQRGVFGLFESILVVSWVHPREDEVQRAQIEGEVQALLAELPAIIQRNRIAGETLESRAIHQLALGGSEGRVTAAEWRRLFGEALARMQPVTASR
jgi:hypothetical protein